MAKTKDELLEAARAAGLVAADANADAFTRADLEGLLSTDKAAWEGSLSATEPITAPDGHVTLSQEDIDARAS